MAKLQKNQFAYDYLLSLGFDKENYTDYMVFNQLGHHPVYLILYLCKGISIHWMQDDMILRVYRRISQSQHKVFEIKDQDQLLQMIDFFERKPKVKRKNKY